MAQGFVDIEHAFDTVRREMIVTTVRWMASARSRSQVDGKQCTSEQKEEQTSMKSFTLYHGINQKEDQHVRCSQEGDVHRRSGHNSREHSGTTSNAG